MSNWSSYFSDSDKPSIALGDQLVRRQLLLGGGLLPAVAPQLVAPADALRPPLPIQWISANTIGRYAGLL
eukprot:6175181-Pleurochrysis_carterae.AAC.1